MTDKPVLNTPGEMLVAARRSAGLDLEAVAAATKIPINILGHLERDEYHRVSGALYVNSFLRTYATEVGLEPSLVVEAYARFSGERIGPSESAAGETVWAEEEVQIKRVGLPWLQIGLVAGLVLVLIGTGVWFFGLRGEPEPAGPPPAAVVQEDAPLPQQPAADVDEAEETAGESAETETREEAADAGEADAEPKVTIPVVVETRPAETATPPARTKPPLPYAEEGVPSLNFADGIRWPLVLRVTMDEPVGIEVVCDSDREPLSATWPADATALPTLPTVGVEHGQPYRVYAGYVVYWGARDQFSLRLDETRGVTVELNGDRRDLSGLQPGQELILFLPSGRR